MVGDEAVTNVTVTVPTFPVCCIQGGQKERVDGLIGNCYPYGPITETKLRINIVLPEI